MRKRKRAYLLLEVMIAFTILLFCLAPLLESPLRLLRLQISSAEKSEIARIEPLHFALAKAALYKNDVPWEMLSKKKEKTPISYTELDKEVSVYGIPSRDRAEKQESRIFQTKVYFWNAREAKNKEGDELLLVNVRLIFKPLKGKQTAYRFDHQVFVKRAGKNAQKAAS